MADTFGNGNENGKGQAASAETTNGIPRAPGRERGILVVGGGMAGISAAIEASEAGSDVYVIEQGPSLGGRVAQLHQYFPKLCPPYCGLEINFRRIRSARACTTRRRLRPLENRTWGRPLRSAMICRRLVSARRARGGRPRRGRSSSRLRTRSGGPG